MNTPYLLARNIYFINIISVVHLGPYGLFSFHPEFPDEKLFDKIPLYITEKYPRLFAGILIVVAFAAGGKIEHELDFDRKIMPVAAVKLHIPAGFA